MLVLFTSVHNALSSIAALLFFSLFHRIFFQEFERLSEVKVKCDADIIKANIDEVSVTQEDGDEICADVLCREAKDVPRSCCICLGEESENMIILRSCGHSVHQDCIKGQLAAGWTGKRISFGFLCCGECRTPIVHKKLKSALSPHLKLKKEVEQMCYNKCLEDDVIEDLEIKKKRDYLQTMQECFDKLSCFMCTSCDKPFCGGRMDCAQDDDLDVSKMKCASCTFEALSQKSESDNSADNWRGKCFKHGYKYAMYKCDSCCSLATFDCRSNHYCTRCHDQAYSEKNYPCPGLENCPLGIEHPPNQSAIHGEDRNEFIEGFVVGCYKCFTQSEEEPSGFVNEPQWEARF